MSLATHMSCSQFRGGLHDAFWPSDPTPKSCSMHSFSVTVHLADTNARAKASQEQDGLVCFVSRMRVGHRQCTAVKRCAISS